ncbi:hypothetical protein MKX03_026499, partial [Papaver bracteatum]
VETIWCATERCLSRSNYISRDLLVSTNLFSELGLLLFCKKNGTKFKPLFASKHL